MKTTKFCHACGAQLPITAKFCRGCGSALSDVEVISKPLTPTEPIQSPIQQTVTPSSASTTSQPEKSSNTTAIIVSVIAIVMAAIGYGIWVKSKSSETLGVGATPAQTQAAEAVAVDDVSTADKFRDDTFDTVAG